MTSPSATVCIANIGPAERRKRWVVGVVGVAVCVAATLLLVLNGSSRWWRLSLFLPWCVSALGIFQARANTCVALAARGIKQLGDTPEAVPRGEMAAIQAQARQVKLRSVLVALLATGLSLLV